MNKVEQRLTDIHARLVNLSILKNGLETEETLLRAEVCAIVGVAPGSEIKDKKGNSRKVLIADGGFQRVGDDSPAVVAVVFCTLLAKSDEESNVVVVHDAPLQSTERRLEARA